MKIYLGADHAGFELKEHIKEFLKKEGYEVSDEGAFSFKAEDDYPDYMRLVALQVASDIHARGILFGGSGQGEAITANRLPNVRACVYYGGVSPKEEVDISGIHSDSPLEIVRLSRIHNDANILSLGARFLTTGEAEEAVSLWLRTPFSGETRHTRRIKKIDGLLDDELIF